MSSVTGRAYTKWRYFFYVTVVGHLTTAASGGFAAHYTRYIGRLATFFMFDTMALEPQSRLPHLERFFALDTFARKTHG